MKIYALAAILLFVVHAGIAGAVEVVDLASAVGRLQATLEAIPAVEAASVSSYSMTPEYYEHNKVTPTERPGHTVERKTTMAGSEYRFATKSVSKNGQIYWDEDVAYDGRFFQWFNRVNDTLCIWKKTRVKPYDLYASPLDQFGFIRGFTRDKTEAIRFEELKSPELWGRILSKAKFLGYRQIDGRRVLSFEFRDTYDTIPCRYEVDLSPENGFFPIRWAAYGPQGELFEEFKVNEIGKASFDALTYYYPKSAVGQFAGITGKFIGKTFIARTWETSSFKIEPVDPTVFTIDPSVARVIRNEDTRTAEVVPK